MKKIIMLIIIIGLIFLVSTPAMAEGDKVRGNEIIQDNIEGPVFKLGDCPFIG